MFLFRGLIVRIAIVFVVLVVAAGAGWWFFIREDAKLATSAPAIPEEAKSSSAPAGSGTSTGSTRYSIIPEQSEAAFFANEKLAKLSLPSTAKGSTKVVQGTFYLTPNGLDTTQESKFTVDLTTLKSDERQRDRQVQGRGLETAKYPTATFVATKIEGLPADFPAGQEVPLKLTGTMDLHGVQKQLTWDVKMRKEGNAISALATVTFKYADFGIPQLNIAGIVSVEDSVTLQMQVVAQAA